MYLTFVNLGLSLFQNFLEGLQSHPEAPIEVVQAIQSAVSAIQKHKDDLVNKANLEAQRG